MGRVTAAIWQTHMPHPHGTGVARTYERTRRTHERLSHHMQTSPVPERAGEIEGGKHDMTTTRLVFLDTETTGLDPDRHSVWEVAWALEDDPIQSAVIPHTLIGADPAALLLNGYFDRVGVQPAQEAITAEANLMADLRGSTVVGSNPAFDTAFLRNRWGQAPWHYRLFDVSAYAAGVLGLHRPPSLRDVASELRARGWDPSEPDHTAAGDVLVLREVFRILQRESGLA